MSDSNRRMHPAHSGRVSDPVLWGFETRELLLVAVGFGMSLACFTLLYNGYRWNAIPSIVVSSLPVAGVISWILLMVSGKPRRYAVDAFIWWQHRLRQQLRLPLTFLAPGRTDAVPHPLLRNSTSFRSKS